LPYTRGCARRPGKVYERLTHKNSDTPRGPDHNRLGFALQLTTIRFLGTFLENPEEVPNAVLQTLVRQLRITNLDRLPHYRGANQRWKHAAEIRWQDT
jgi:hypothetical protein